jgi:hypothetical protein
MGAGAVRRPARSRSALFDSFFSRMCNSVLAPDVVDISSAPTEALIDIAMQVPAVAFCETNLDTNLQRDSLFKYNICDSQVQEWARSAELDWRMYAEGNTAYLDWCKARSAAAATATMLGMRVTHNRALATEGLRGSYSYPRTRRTRAPRIATPGPVAAGQGEKDHSGAEDGDSHHHHKTMAMASPRYKGGGKRSAP